MNIVVIVQARMGSTRLPGKVMLPLGGQSVLAHVIERCRAIPSASKVVIATTVLPVDDIIEAEARRLGVDCYRGSEEDVLSRYYEAAKISRADAVVRITSDCPLLDPHVSNQVIAAFLQDREADYCSNVMDRTFPRGLDTEVFSFQALEDAHFHAVEPVEREHVTPYIIRRPERFRQIGWQGESDDSGYRWTLDTIDDYHLLYKLFHWLSIAHPEGTYDYRHAVSVMEAHPELASINAHVMQKTK
jgi:spore coat polysaccharide biosynthesis protein SpsF